MKKFRYQGKLRGLETPVSFPCGPRNAAGMRIREAATLLCVCKASFPRQAWAAGDIVSCLIDLDDGTLSFCL